jgi:hypothetical protein
MFLDVIAFTQLRPILPQALGKITLWCEISEIFMKQDLTRSKKRISFGKEEKIANATISLAQQRLDANWSEAVLSDCCCCLYPGGDEEKQEDLARCY